MIECSKCGSEVPRDNNHGREPHDAHIVHWQTRGWRSIRRTITMTKRCYVFDLDGTLADLSHRLVFIGGDAPKDWRSFFAAAGGDAPIEPMVELYRTIRYSTYHSYSGTKMVIVSGRSDECREATEAWLEHHEIHYDALYMRKQGDHSDDTRCKQELLKQLLADGWEPILFVDDRDRVVNMWRELGYTCLQCAPGGF